MKVLAELRDFCVSHAGNQQAPDVELVIFEHCVECDPDSDYFHGTETSLPVTTAVVVDRPDLDFFSYKAIITDSLLRSLHWEAEDRNRIEELADEEARSLLDIAEDYPTGSALIRRRGNLFHVWSQERAS